MRLVLALLASCLATSASSQSLTGTVYDANQQSIAGANVVVAETSFGAATDLNGRFVIVGMAPGRYTVVASAVGHRSATKPVMVPEEGSAQIAFVLAEEALDVGEVVVSARETLTGLGVLDLPGSAHYIGPEVLDRFAFGDVHRVLREVPGVQMQEEDGYGLRPNIGLRGTGTERSSKITLMEDGVLMAPAPYAAPAAYYFPTVGRMEGVEVRTGASQIKYGPYTTGGALNLLAATIPAHFEARGEAMAGARGQRLVHARAGTSWPKAEILGGLGVGFVVEGYLDNVDGFKRLQGQGGTVVEDYDTGFDKGDLFGRLRLSTAPDAALSQSLTFTAGYTDEVSNETYLGLTAADFAATPYLRYAGSQHDQMDAEHLALRARHVAVFSDRMDLTTTVYRNRFSRNWYKLDKVADGLADDESEDGLVDEAVGIAAVLEAPERYAGELATVQGTGGGQLYVKANNRDYYSEGVQSVAGLRLGNSALGSLIELGLRIHADGMDRFQWVDGYRLEEGTMTLARSGTPGSDSNRLERARAVASFVQADVDWGRFSITPGLRFEHVRLSRDDFGREDPERTGVELSTRENTVQALIPGIGALYRVTDEASVFMGVHRGFAPPDSRPDTRPERSVNAELGARYSTTALQAQAAIYAHDYSNLLGSDLAAAGGGGTTDQFNGGSVMVKGAELSATGDLARPIRLDGWVLPLRVAYTYTEARFQSSFESEFEGWGTVEEGDELPYLPAHQVGFSAGLERGALSLTLGGAYVATMRSVAGQGAIADSEHIAGHTVIDVSAEWALQRGVAVFGRVSNLLDETYLVSRRPAGLRPGLPRTVALGIRAQI